MVVTELGIMMEVKLVQFKKARLPILITESGIVIDVRLLQQEKALLPIMVTFLGMIKESKFSQYKKALSPIVLILSPKLTYLSFELQYWVIQYGLTSLSHFNVSTLKQSWKALSSMLVTEFETDIELRLLQQKNAYFPIVLMLSPRTTDLRVDLQNWVSPKGVTLESQHIFWRIAHFAGWIWVVCAQ